jgi:hypothetical protein
MLRLDTPEQWAAVQPLLVPATVTSRVHGPIPVPCTAVLLVRRELVQANTYNPNHVPADKMELLRTSILGNGFCFPVVTIWDPDLQHFVIIDGFHRSLIFGPDWLDCDYLPIVVLPHTVAQRLAATAQFNKARGFHQVDLDADLVRALLEQGLTEEQVSEQLGLELEAVHRYKQLTGIAELFARADWSLAWEMVDEVTT